jgi:hypothetical protein
MPVKMAEKIQELPIITENGRLRSHYDSEELINFCSVLLSSAHSLADANVTNFLPKLPDWHSTVFMPDYLECWVVRFEAFGVLLDF